MSQEDSFVPELADFKRFIKPNVRKMFIPSSQHTVFDCDLKQADAYTVAWEAGDEVLKEIFRADEDLHRQNAIDIYGLPHGPDRHQRQMAKHGVHATNFGATPRTMAKKLDMTLHQATQFQARWFKLHPAIKKWQERVELELMKTRTVKNIFGYRRIFFGRVEKLLPEALAWVPQSTTVNIIDKGLLNVARNIPEVQLLLQVHDSGVGQFLNEYYSWIRKEIQKCMLIELPYDDPITIPVEIECSRLSWGDCKKVPFEDDETICPH